jgi:peptidoglycan/LPS O-acetylase OafA/YrhL
VFFDGLRFLLAMTVVVGHGFGFFFGYWNGFFPLKFPYIQSIAVVGFFFVSGFLISGSVFSKLQNNRICFKSYMVDRFSRIYCTLIPCILFVAVVDYASYKIFPSYEFSGSLSFSIFFENLLLIPSMPYGSMRPIWSLMFEWWIYILFGGLVFFNRNRMLGAVAIVLGGYYTFFVNGQGEAGQIEVIWMVGAISAALFEKVSDINFNKLIVSILLFASAAAIWVEVHNAYNLYAGSLFSAGLLFLAAHKNTGNSLSTNKSIAYRFLAGYSYTLFLTHYTVLSLVWRVGIQGIRGFLLSFIAANIIASVIAMYTEKHHKNVSKWMNKKLIDV